MRLILTTWRKEFRASSRRLLHGFATGVVLLFPNVFVHAADVPKAPVPQSPYIAVVYRYADAMLEKGRDTYGPQKTSLFLSALDRVSMSPLTNRPTPPTGVREGDRVGAKGAALTGANPQHDENFLRLLYTLSELSAKPKYRDAADVELRWFLQNAASPATHLFPWGEHMSWEVVKDEAIAADESGIGTHEFFRPWLLWDRCFELAPAASKQFALGLWEHQIANHATGAFDRQAGFSKHLAQDKIDSPRHAGFFIRMWASAYAQTKDEQFLKCIEVLVNRFEQKRRPKTGLIEAYTGSSSAWVASTLSLAIDCDGAAHHVPESLASRLRAFGAREDEVFCSVPHDVKSRSGFLASVDKITGEPKEWHTRLWSADDDRNTTAQIGMMCVSRYENTGKVGYRELIHAAADAYMKSLPAADEDAWPVTFGHAISLELATWRSTARQAYFDRARELANFAVEKFFNNGPLPRASLKTDHYESITGADALVLALLEVHLHVLHITAVRCPPNTIDR
jgi:hypothetical protein